MLTGRGLDRAQSGLPAARRMPPGAEQQHGNDDERSRCGVPEPVQDATRGVAGMADTMMARVAHSELRPACPRILSRAFAEPSARLTGRAGTRSSTHLCPARSCRTKQAE